MIWWIFTIPITPLLYPFLSVEVVRMILLMVLRMVHLKPINNGPIFPILIEVIFKINSGITIFECATSKRRQNPQVIQVLSRCIIWSEHGIEVGYWVIQGFIYSSDDISNILKTITKMKWKMSFNNLIQVTSLSKIILLQESCSKLIFFVILIHHSRF